MHSEKTYRENKQHMLTLCATRRITLKASCDLRDQKSGEWVHQENTAGSQLGIKTVRCGKWLVSFFTNLNRD